MNNRLVPWDRRLFFAFLCTGSSPFFGRKKDTRIRYNYTRCRPISQALNCKLVCESERIRAEASAAGCFRPSRIRRFEGKTGIPCFLSLLICLRCFTIHPCEGRQQRSAILLSAARPFQKRKSPKALANQGFSGLVGRGRLFPLVAGTRILNDFV